MARKWSKNRWAHRRLHMTAHFKDPQRGLDVAELQKAINHRAKVYDLGRPIEVDGKCGRATIGRGRRVAKALGIGLKGPGLSVYVQHLIRHPKLRTPAQRRRGQAWRKEHIPTGPTVKGNVVIGGTVRERIVAACHAAVRLYQLGKSHRFYSQAGDWTVKHGITGEPRGYRSDCSQFATSMYHSAGLHDPNGANYGGGYTGTLGQHGRYIRRGQLQPGDLVLYGPPPHHHVEVYVGPGDRTIGHGSPPVDYGDIYMQTDPHFVTYDL